MGQCRNSIVFGQVVWHAKYAKWNIPFTNHQGSVQYKCLVLGIAAPIIKIRWSHYCLIFISLSHSKPLSEPKQRRTLEYVLTWTNAYSLIVGYSKCDNFFKFWWPCWMTSLFCKSVVKLAILRSDNGLLPGRCQAIIWSSEPVLECC